MTNFYVVLQHKNGLIRTSETTVYKHNHVLTITDIKTIEDQLHKEEGGTWTVTFYKRLGED